MSEHEWKKGDEAWVRGEVVEVDTEDDDAPCRIKVEGFPTTSWPPRSEIRPAPPEPAGGKPFRVKGRSGVTWLKSIIGLNSSPSRIAGHYTLAEDDAFPFPPHWRPVFAAEPDRFEIVDVEPETPESIAFAALDRIATDPQMSETAKRTAREALDLAAKARIAQIEKGATP